MEEIQTTTTLEPAYDTGAVDDSANSTVDNSADTEMDAVQEVPNIDEKPKVKILTDGKQYFDAPSTAKFLDIPYKTLCTRRDRKIFLADKKVGKNYYYRVDRIVALKKKMESEKVVTVEYIAPSENLSTGISDAQVETTTAIVTYENQVATTELDNIGKKIKFHLDQTEHHANQTFYNVVKTGQYLIQAKKLVGHGQWGNWLKDNDNFSLSQETARRYMAVAERYGNSTTLWNLGEKGELRSSQIFQFLALPADDTEKFIEQKAAAGVNVAELSTRQLNAAIEDYQAKLKKKDAEIAQYKEQAEKAESENLTLKDEVKRTQDLFNAREQSIKEVTVSRDTLKNQLDDAQKEIKQLHEKPIEYAVQKPADYAAIKAELATLKAQDKVMARAESVVRDLETIHNLTQSLMTVNRKILLAAIRAIIDTKDENAFMEMLADIERFKVKCDDLFSKRDDDNTDDV